MQLPNTPSQSDSPEKKPLRDLLVQARDRLTALFQELDVKGVWQRVAYIAKNWQQVALNDKIDSATHESGHYLIRYLFGQMQGDKQPDDEKTRELAVFFGHHEFIRWAGGINSSEYPDWKQIISTPFTIDKRSTIDEENINTEEKAFHWLMSSLAGIGAQFADEQKDVKGELTKVDLRGGDCDLIRFNRIIDYLGKDHTDATVNHMSLLVDFMNHPIAKKILDSTANHLLDVHQVKDKDSIDAQMEEVWLKDGITKEDLEELSAEFERLKDKVMAIS